MRRALLLIAVLSSCSHSPSRSELFQLRSQCKDLADKLSQNNPPSGYFADDGKVTVQAHYSPISNRCYVLLFETSELYAMQDKTLLDGQSGKVLIWESITSSSRLGHVYSEEWTHLVSGQESYAHADALISAKMSEGDSDADR